MIAVEVASDKVIHAIFHEKYRSAGKDGACIRSTTMEEKLSQVELFCRDTPIQIFYRAMLKPVFPSLINFRGFGSGLQYIKWKTCSGLSVALTRINYAPSPTGCN